MDGGINGVWNRRELKGKKPMYSMRRLEGESSITKFGKTAQPQDSGVITLVTAFGRCDVIEVGMAVRTPERK